MQILQRHGCEKCIHSAELVVQQWKRANLDVANFTKRELHLVIFAPESQQCLGSSMLFKDVAEIGASLPLLCGLVLQLLELGEAPRDYKG